MSFINHNKFLEIQEAARGGNEIARQILQAISKNASQGDLDRLVGEYYKVPPVETKTEVETETQPVTEPVVETEEKPIEKEVVDISDLLDNELDGLIDENKVEDLSFSDFLENKKRDSLRARKNNEYFKAFDLEGRNNYLTNMKNKYSEKFGDRLHDIDRNFQDIDISLGKYHQSINDLLDDGIDLNMDNASKAYEEIIGNNGITHSWGRYWDDTDTNHVIDDLKVLVGKYGKNNVLAALNTLKNDNTNYKDYRTNQIDTEIGRYSKSIENLLK